MINVPSHDEFKISDVHSGDSKSKRVNDILRFINELDNNLLLYDERYQNYHYVIKFNQLENCDQEIAVLCGQIEIKKLQLKNKLLQHLIDKHKIIEHKKSPVPPYKIIVKKDMKAFGIIRDHLSEYESMIRDLSTIHGLDISYKNRQEEQIDGGAD